MNHVSLCGFPPFYSAHGLPMSPGMKSRIRTGQYAFPSPEWDRVSESAKGLIRGLLKTDPSERMTIDQVMSHVWITHYARVPETPLHTVAQLREQEQGQWSEMQDEMESTLASMRVEECNLKTLNDVNNPLLAKRKKKQKAEQPIAEEPAAKEE